jgi:Domain of unknown function (DUF4177)
MTGRALQETIMAEEGASNVRGTRWEYETLLIGNDKLTLSPALARVAAAGPRPWPGTPFEDAMNEMGRNGWELVGIANLGASAQTLAVFKRPLP